MKPPVRYGESTPDADQTSAHDGRKPSVLTRNNSSRRNPPGKEKSQKKGIINIGGSEGGQAGREHAQISIHKDSIFPFL
jgi:hypothetical protein